jgi:hypothetical protein
MLCIDLIHGLDICGLVHRSNIHKEKSNKMQHCIKILLFHIYMKLNMFRAQCAWQRPPTTRPTTFHVRKTKGCQCSFRLLIMGGVSPETCWASYKYGIIQILIYCWIMLNFFYELIHGINNNFNPKHINSKGQKFPLEVNHPEMLQ